MLIMKLGIGIFDKKQIRMAYNIDKEEIGRRATSIYLRIGKKKIK